MENNWSSHHTDSDKEIAQETCSHVAFQKRVYGLKTTIAFLDVVT